MDIRQVPDFMHVACGINVRFYIHLADDHLHYFWWETLQFGFSLCHCVHVFSLKNVSIHDLTLTRCIEMTDNHFSANSKKNSQKVCIYLHTGSSKI